MDAIETRLRIIADRQARELGTQDALIMQLRQQLASAKADLAAAKADIVELQAMVNRAHTENAA